MAGALAEAGEIETGIGELRAGVDKLTSIGLQVNQSYLRSLLADAYAKAERITEALAALDDSLQIANRNEERFWEAELYRLRGDLLLRQGHRGLDESEACFVHAVEIATEQKAKSLELRALTSLCRLRQRESNSVEAAGRLATVYNWFTEGGTTPDLQQARVVLARASASR